MQVGTCISITYPEVTFVGYKLVANDFFEKKFLDAFRKFDYLCRAICITTNYGQNNN